jgi:hypothetical protein
VHSVHGCHVGAAALRANSRALLCLPALRPHGMGAAPALTAKFLIFKLV